MSQPRTSLAAVAEAARAFVDACDELPADTTEAAALIHQRLVLLYSAASQLGPGGDDFGEPELSEVYPNPEGQSARVGATVERVFGERCWYWHRYDPIFPRDGGGELGCADLVDDLQDIYADVAPALRAWDAGSERVDDMHFAWGGTPFQSHWGIHAAQAIRALHWIVFDHGVPGQED